MDSLPVGIRQAGSAAPVGESHRPVGAWAYDHGVAAHLSLQRGHTRNCVDESLGFVILRRPVRPAGVGHTSGCVNLEFTRTPLAKCSEFLSRNSRFPRKANFVCYGRGASPGMHRGVAPLAGSRFASASHSAHCSGSSAHRHSQSVRTAQHSCWPQRLWPLGKP